MPDPNPLQNVVSKLMELRREDELRAVSTLRGSINALSCAVELSDPGVLERTKNMLEVWLSNRTDTEQAAIVIHASLVMLAIVRASNEDDPLLDIDELLRKHGRAAAERAAKER